MVGMKDGQEVWFAQFAKPINATTGKSSWLRALRKMAIDRFTTLGFPTVDREQSLHG